MSAAPFIDAASAMTAAKDAPDWAVPSPPRAGCTVTPLIEAADMFPTLERLVLEAERTVWLAFRIFDPDTATRSEQAKALGLHDWKALLRHAVERGVAVRILLADFEPVMADYLHAGSWRSFRALREVVEALPEDNRSRLQLLVVGHEGELGWGWRVLLQLPLRHSARRLVERLLGGGKADDGGIDTRPGLWPFVRWDGGRARGWRAGRAGLLPATYHQKFAVVDGVRAVIGGMDLDERRWDDRRHRQRADRTWHDISALLRGPVVGDAARHFARLWNRELPRYRETVARWNGSRADALMIDPLDPIEGEPPLPPPAEGAATVQLARTVSRRSRAALAIGPQPMIRELMAAHRALIGAAQRRLYIEAQFFRSQPAADWLVAALERQPELELIVLVANVPEEVAFEGQSGNLAHRHGEYLQARALGRLLRKAGPSRVGLFTLAKQERVRSDEKAFEESRGTAFGSGLIHIHSKLLIADDRHCLMSSANINGRSFDWDTELGFLWSEEGGAIGGFRQRLWAQLFGGDPPADLAGWRDIARHNAAAAPEQRRGFVVPYQLGRARRFARPYWFVPDDLV